MQKAFQFLFWSEIGNKHYGQMRHFPGFFALRVEATTVSPTRTS